MFTNIIQIGLAACFVVATTGSGLALKEARLHEDGSAASSAPLPDYLKRGVEWLVEAQFENGGWGAGSHSAQNIRDPRNVQVDPATTAFATMALIRAGNTLTEGAYKNNVRKAVKLLVEMVEEAPEQGHQISSVSGTQPQAKLGQNIDASMVAQLLTKTLALTEGEPALHNRVSAALKKCLRKLEGAQSSDGSWSAPGWAPVLQSAMAQRALEGAGDAGVEVDESVMARSREYQASNIGDDGTVRTEAAAGVSLYAIASNQRTNAKAARDAKRAVEKAKKDGRLDNDAEPDVESLVKAGVNEEEATRLAGAYKQSKSAVDMLQSEAVLSGFGNNGGEEYLSYMMTSEALRVSEDGEWDKWQSKMGNRFQQVQNQDGSWSGHHCITSPVFCTAAVILAATSDRDETLG